MIVPVKKVTFVGLTAEREGFVRRLQEVGITHLILPAEPAEPAAVSRELAKVNEARKFLARRLQKGDQGQAEADWTGIMARRDELMHHEARLQNELAVLQKERAQMAPFGEFDPESVEDLRRKGLVVRFYRSSRRAFEALPAEGAYVQVTGEAAGEVAFVLFALAPPELGLIEEKLPLKRLSAVEAEIAANLDRQARIQEQYSALAEQVGSLKEAELLLTDEVEYRRALMNAEDELDDRLFVLRCWSPASEDDLVRRIGPGFTFLHYAEDPQEGDKVPVLLSNKRALAPGEDLVKVYSHPNHSDFDPSGLVLYCFSIFYGMIIGDAGYGLVLLGLGAWLWKKFKDRGATARRVLTMNFMLSLSTIFFGVISMSYFGIQFDQISWLKGSWLVKILAAPQLMDMGSVAGQNKAMLVSIVFGMVHISLALAIKFKRTRDFPSLGWILVIWGGFFFIKAKMGADPTAAAGLLPTVGLWVMLAGFALVLLFTSKSRNPIFRVLAGLNGCLGAIQLFADILSYMRLFALGLGTMYMCMTFNNLAMSVKDGLGWLVGFLPIVLILVAGHLINIGLGIMGGVVHGLRLNFLEWYRWCFEGDGLPFKPFRQVSKALATDRRTG